MSILIKGMEMPPGGTAEAIVIHSDGTVGFLHEDDYRVLKAIPVPPHGDLIERDAFVECLATLLQFPSNLVNGQWIVNTLREQPTIIPAEEE